MQHVADLADGGVALGAGTVYMSLGKLESDGLVTVTSRDGRRTNYLITPKGAEVLRAEARRVAAWVPVGIFVAGGLAALWAWRYANLTAGDARQMLAAGIVFEAIAVAIAYAALRIRARREP